MKRCLQLFGGFLLAFVWLLPAEAGELGSSRGEGPISGGCRTGLDGVTTCIRIRGYVWAGDGFPAHAPAPVGGAFAPTRLGFSKARLGSEPQPGASFGPVRVYVDSGANWSR